MTRADDGVPPQPQHEHAPTPPPRDDAETAPFATAELAIVLSHYDLGVISSVARFRRGSDATPKLLVAADAGKFVLKRRNDADPARSRLSHRLQKRLAAEGFPLPHLVGTRRDKRTLLELNGRSYELFRFLEGSRFDHSSAHTRLAGYALALFHEIAAGLDASELTSAPSFHNNPQTPYHLRDLDLAGDAHHELALRYEHAASNAQQIGVPDWPEQTIHGDWHPGNMLFEQDRLAAVIDYETARSGPRVLDLASGALQFSLTAGGPPDRWPDNLDDARFAAFLSGYEALADEKPDDASARLVSRAELHAIPHLMIEALISEVAATIAATGRFGPHDAETMLQAVHRKARWIADNTDRLAAALDEQA